VRPTVRPDCHRHRYSNGGDDLLIDGPVSGRGGGGGSVADE
jgi:hypothetical protein